MALKAPLYQQEFGLVPGFRAGLHGGSIVAGECGDDKREIVYFGDTINTAARIQEIGRACVGKECVSQCRSRWSPEHSKKTEKRDAVMNDESDVIYENKLDHG